MNDLYRVYPQYKKDCYDKDARLVIQSVTDYLTKLIQNFKKKWLEASGKENTSIIRFHFIFVVPTEWGYAPSNFY
jgi:hypothetical protein